MTDRAASSTAVLVCQGRAAAHGRLAVGRFSDPVAEHLLDPDERTVVEQARSQHPPQGGPGRMAYELVRRTSVLMVPRTVAIDDAVRDHGAQQVVVVGAGLDARAWRMPELARATLFEVDHPASQRDKQRRLSGIEPTAGQVVAVAVDLEHDPLAPVLRATGFDPALETTWVWEGVVPYLTSDAVAETVRHLAELSAPGSILVVNYQSRSVSASVMRRVMRVAMRLTRQHDPMAGEPWRSAWSPDTMRAMLGRNGFETTRDDDLLTLASGLDLPHHADASLRNGRVAVALRR
ncbi:MAG: class I SAM-dependent methyltransferase [Ornithinibacter sp.]